MPVTHPAPTLWSKCCDAFRNRQQGTKGTKTSAPRSKTRASRNRFSQDAADVFRWTLQVAFSSSPPELLMLLIMISHQQGTFWHPPQRPPHLLSPQKQRFPLTANIYYFWLYPQRSASSSRACPINLHILHGARAHAHACAGSSKHNIIGQRFEVTASPSGDIVFRSVKYSRGLHSHVEPLLCRWRQCWGSKTLRSPYLTPANPNCPWQPCHKAATCQ